MTTLTTFDKFGINEAATPTLQLADERDNQAKLNDQITDLKSQMAKVDASNKKQSDKDKQKSGMQANIGKLTVQVGQSMQKEAQLMNTVATGE